MGGAPCERWLGQRPAIARQLNTLLPLILALIAYGVAANLLLDNLDYFTGDEPHYLLIAHSLCYDGDIDLKNNYEEQDYLSFHPDPNLDPHAYDYLGNGELHSIHNIGLPLLLTLPYCLLKNPDWARMEMAILAALASWVIFLLIRQRTNRHAVAWLTWGVVTFSSPLWTLSPQVYPDVVAVLGIAIALLLLRPPFSSSKILALGIVMAILPWMHSRLAFLSFPILVTALVYLLRSGRRCKQVALLLIVPGVSAILWLWSSYAWYGSPLPEAAFSPMRPHLRLFSWWNWYVALVDLGLGREFGLLTYAPVYWVALVGAVAMVLRRKKDIWLPGLLLVGYVLVVSLAAAAYRAGPGYQFPARLLLPIVPALAIPLAYALSQARWLRIAALALLLVSAIIGMQSLTFPYKALDNRNGVSEIPFLKDLQQIYPPTLFTRKSANLELSRLPRQVGQLLVDPETNTEAMVARPQQDDPGYMIFGPYWAFQTGSYTATFTLRTQAPDPETRVAQVDVYTGNGEHILARRDIYGRDFGPDGRYRDFALTFYTRGTWALEFRVYFTDQVEVWLQGIDIEPHAKLPHPTLLSWPIVAGWSASVVLAGLWLSRHGRMSGKRTTAGGDGDSNAP